MDVINSTQDFWNLVNLCRDEGMDDMSDEMVERVARAILESNFPLNTIANEIEDQTRTQLLNAAKKVGVTGFTRFN